MASSREDFDSDITVSGDQTEDLPKQIVTGSCCDMVAGGDGKNHDQSIAFPMNGCDTYCDENVLKQVEACTSERGKTVDDIPELISACDLKDSVEEFSENSEQLKEIKTGACNNDIENKAIGSETVPNELPQSEENSTDVTPDSIPIELDSVVDASTESEPVIVESLDSNWRNSLKTMQSKLKFIITNKNPFFDVTFLVGTAKQEISAHKFILILSSQLFERMIKEAENKNMDKIIVSDVEPDAFNELLFFIYTDEFKDQNMNNIELALSVMTAATKFKIPELSRNISNLVKSKLTVENCVYVFERAQHNLMGDSQQFIMMNATQVFARKEYLSLSHSKLCKLLVNNGLLLDEMTVFEKALSWAKENCERMGLAETTVNLRQVLDDALYLIRFPLISPQDFTINVIRHGILSESEQLEIFKYFSVRDLPNSKSIVSEFRFNCQPRGNVPVKSNNTLIKTSSQTSITSIVSDNITNNSRSIKINEPAAIPPLLKQPWAVEQSLSTSSSTTSNFVSGPSTKDATNSACATPLTPLEKETRKNIVKFTEELFDNLSEESFHESITSFTKIPICNNQGRAQCFVKVYFRKLNERAPMCYLFAKFIDVALRNTNQTQRLKLELLDFSDRIYKKQSLYDQIVQQEKQKLDSGKGDIGKYEEKKSKLRFQYLCNVKLMAEFYKLKLINLAHIMSVASSFIDKPNDESMENLYHLLINCGKDLDEHLVQMNFSELPLFKANWMDTIFQQLIKFSDLKELRFETRLLLIEIMEWRRKGWTNTKARPGS